MPMVADLDIILPMFNPQPGWSQNIITSYCRLLELSHEVSIRIILVNDGSTTPIENSHLEELQAKLPLFQYIHYPDNAGKGFAVRKGASVATAPHVIFTDIDFPYLEEDLLKIYDQLRLQEADVAWAIRKDGYYQQAPWFRRLISRTLKVMIRFLFRIPTSDTQGGLKGFSPEGLEVLKQTTVDRYLFDLELVKRASSRQGLSLVQLEAQLKPEIKFSPVGWKILFRESKNFWRIFWLKTP